MSKEVYGFSEIKLDVGYGYDIRESEDNFSHIGAAAINGGISYAGEIPIIPAEVEQPTRNLPA